MHKQQGWPQAWEYCQAKLIQTLGRASQGVNWSWSQCIKSHRAQTSSGKGLPSHFWNRNIVRSILPGLKRKITLLLLSGPKSSFQIKVNFAFHLEIKVPESGGREERHIIHVAWGPVWSFHSRWWFGLPWHLLVLVHCVLSSPKSMQPSTRRFWSTLCFHLLTSFMEMLISFSSRTLAPPHRAKTTQVLCWPWYCCAWLASQQAWPEPCLESMGYFQEKDEKQSIQQHRRAEDSITPQQCHSLIALTPHRTDAGVCAEGAPAKYWAHKWTYFKELELFCFEKSFFYWS